MLVTMLIVLLALGLAGVSWGYSSFGYASLSPLGIILIVVLVLWLSGHLHVR
jgi:hypothetical protein